MAQTHDHANLNDVKSPLWSYCGSPKDAGHNHKIDGKTSLYHPVDEDVVRNMMLHVWSFVCSARGREDAPEAEKQLCADGDRQEETAIPPRKQTY